MLCKFQWHLCRIKYCTFFIVLNLNHCLPGDKHCKVILTFLVRILSTWTLNTIHYTLYFTQAIILNQSVIVCINGNVQFYITIVNRGQFPDNAVFAVIVIHYQPLRLMCSILSSPCPDPSLNHKAPKFKSKLV